MKKKLFLFFYCVFCLSFGLFIQSCNDNSISETNKVTLTFYIGENESPFISTYKIDELKVGYKFFQNIPTSEGKEFCGLFDNLQNGKEFVDKDGKIKLEITNDITLYAKWINKEYSFIFNANGGALDNNSYKYTYDEVINSFPIPTLEGYDFIGWKDNNGSIISDANGIPLADNKLFTNKSYNINNDQILLEAVYSIKNLTITFNYNNSDISDTTQVLTYGQDSSLIDFPNIKDDHKKIIKWSLKADEYEEFDGVITTDMTFYALWSEYKTIRLFNEKGELNTFEIYENDSFTLPLLNDITGYKFFGWYDNDSYNGNSYSVINFAETNTDFYAKWGLIDYNISFISNSNEQINSITYTIEDECTLPNAKKDNYVFNGWCFKEDLSDEPINKIEKGSTENIILYAKFTPENKTIVLNPNGGEIANDKVDVLYDDDYVLPIPELDGYLFAGWYYNDTKLTDDEGKSLLSYTYDNKSIEAIAKYIKKIHVYVTSSMKDSFTCEVKDYYIAGEKVSLLAIIKDGYIFNGWSLNDNIITSSTDYSFEIGNDDIYLKLIIESKRYTLTLDPNDGYLTKNIENVYFNQKYNLPIAYKQGYEFEGWFIGDEKLTDENGNSLNNWKIPSNQTLIAKFIENKNGILYIYDVETFLNIKNNINGNYSIINDINLKDVTWEPIQFKGTLEGNDHKILNLTLSSYEKNVALFTQLTGKVSNLIFENVKIESLSSSDDTMVGVLAAISSGEIENITISSGSVDGRNGRIGSVVGKVDGGKVFNVTNHVNVNGVANLKNGSTGGIVGWLNKGDVIKCNNYGNINNDYYCGGLIGYMTSGSFSELTNYGDITGKFDTGGIVGLILINNYSFNIYAYSTNNGKVSGKENVGGGIGRLYTFQYGTRYGIISNFTNNGEIIGNDDCVGGIIGKIYFENHSSGVDFTISYSKNYSNIKGANYVGGIVGRLEDSDPDGKNYSFKITTSLNNANITGETYVGGIAGFAQQTIVSECENDNSIITATSYVTENKINYSYLGGFVGKGFYVENCINKAKLNYTISGCGIGGIAGSLNYGAYNCQNKMPITASKANYVGGILGELITEGKLIISKLCNYGKIEGNHFVGGVIGNIISASYTFDESKYGISLIENNGEVKANTYVGGCIGKIRATGNNIIGEMSLDIAGIKNTGNVTANDFVGGCIGHASSDAQSSIYDSSNTGKIVGSAHYGSIGGFMNNYNVVS